ncbi:diguanylate cyclase domain-containing protein [Acetobacterium sp.]|uniref:diguanylate cyclase domain-containing protein n=1 Tax=Acetobacterium sp. TaxID=1872094 RepID=UPI003593A96E
MNDHFSLNELNRQHLNGFFASSMEFLCITDERGTIMKSNRVWETKLGYLTPALIDKNLTDLVHPNDVANLILVIKNLSAENESLPLSCRLRSNNGTYRFVTWQFQWIDKLIYGCAKDLTELYHAKKDAESAEFSKNQLISVLSNEIQEPLESLSLFLQLIGKTPSISNQNICLENIRLSSEFLENLINGILVIDINNQTGHDVTSFDFHNTVEDAIIPLIVSAKRHNITIDLAIHPKIPSSVVGDSQRLKQIISFLVLNAIKCLERGKITIEATPENTGKTVFKIYFNVKTSGIARLKSGSDNPFSINAANESNLNFGLELVKTLVKKMNGKLSATRDSESGYEFSFHVLLLRDDAQDTNNDRGASGRVLPMYNKNIRLKAEELLAIEQIKNDQAKSHNKAITEKRQRILVVDDAPENTQLLAQALVENYEIIVANNGKDALNIVQQDPVPDMILLDLSMPDMSGYEVCKQIQLEESTMAIPIIFLTTLSDTENETYSLQSGAVDFISKPFDLPSVEEKIKNHLALKHYREILSITADIDALTQIPNRRRFDEMLAIEIRKARRNNTPLSVIKIDIDYFKSYNEIYGHLEGDDCLREIAVALKKTLKRAGDLVARWEGEEFSCLLPDTNLKGATHVAENIRKAVLNLRIPHQSSPEAKFVTLSLGVATGIRTHENSGEDSFATLLDHAQAALIKAKEAGRNQVFVYRK